MRVEDLAGRIVTNEKAGSWLAAAGQPEAESAAVKGAKGDLTSLFGYRSSSSRSRRSRRSSSSRSRSSRRSSSRSRSKIEHRLNTDSSVMLSSYQY